MSKIYGTSPSFSALMSADVGAGATNVTSKVPFDSEEWDLESNFDLALSRFTAPVSGVYSFVCGINHSGTSVTSLGMWLYKNGAVFKQLRSGNLTGASITRSASAHVKLDVGDYVEFWAQPQGTGTLLWKAGSFFQGMLSRGI